MFIFNINIFELCHNIRKFTKTQTIISINELWSTDCVQRALFLPSPRGPPGRAAGNNHFLSAEKNLIIDADLNFTGKTKLNKLFW